MPTRLVRAALEPFGFQCEEAEDGNVGIERCVELTPDLVILDVMMPERDGFSVCSEIKKKSKTESTPVLILTALDDLESIQRAYETGATNFQTKPINSKLLPHHVNYMLRTSAFEKNMQEAKRLAEEASAAKSQFLANINHELRTPLNAILAFSEVIYLERIGEIGNAKYLEYAKDINYSAAHLLSILNDILDVSKIESGKLQLDKKLCNPQDILESVVQMTRPLVKGAGLRFKVAWPRDLPMISTDEVRLKQVLFHLLSNAIKFTPIRGEISLAAKIIVEKGIIFTISDTGIGIPTDQVKKALCPFVQVDADLNRKYGGIGLGLPLAKSLTEQLGGTFVLQSHVGQGTRITLTFPTDHIPENVALESRKLAG